MLVERHPLVKNIVIAAALFFFLAGACYYLTVNLEPAPEPADLLPGETLALINIKNLAETASLLKQSPAGKELFDLSFATSLNQLGIDSGYRNKFLSLIKEVKHVIHHPLFQTVFSRKAAFALLPNINNHQRIETFLKNNSLLVIPVKVMMKSELLFEKIFAGKGSLEFTDYQGERLSTVHLGEQDVFYYTIIDNTVACALHPEPLKRFIDFSKDRIIRPRSTLSHNRQFKEFVDADEKEQDVLAYINVQALLDETRRFKVLRQWLPIITGQDERIFYTQYSYEAHTALHLTLKNYLTREDNFIKNYQLSEPRVNSEVNKLDSSVSAYFWTNWLDFDQLWMELGQTPTLSTATLMFYTGQKIFEHTGLDVTTLTSMFGDEFGFFIEDTSVENTVERIPMICFIFSLRRPEEVRKLFANILSEIGREQVPVGEEGVGTTVLVARGLIKPAYYISDTTLFIADDIGLIKRFIEKKKQKLVKSKEFISIDNGFQQKNNVLLYGRIDKINFMLEKILFLTLQVLEQTDKITRVQKNILLDHLLEPFFESMKNVRSQGVRMYCDNKDLTFKLDLYQPQ